MPLLPLLAVAAGLWVVVLPALAIAAGFRHQSAKAHTTHTPDIPATPEEGNHV